MWKMMAPLSSCTCATPLDNKWDTCNRKAVQRSSFTCDCLSSAIRKPLVLHFRQSWHNNVNANGLLACDQLIAVSSIVQTLRLHIGRSECVGVFLHWVASRGQVQTTAIRYLEILVFLESLSSSFHTWINFHSSYESNPRSPLSTGHGFEMGTL
jgi:hypothetical protein